MATRLLDCGRLLTESEHAWPGYVQSKAATKKIENFPPTFAYSAQVVQFVNPMGSKSGKAASFPRLQVGDAEQREDLRSSVFERNRQCSGI